MDAAAPAVASSLIMIEKICAIIVTYNSGPEVRDCVASVAGQVQKIVITDNGSAGNTISILKKIEDDYSPRVIIIQNSDNLGIAAALNRGVKFALEEGYDWVLTLDDDSVAEPGMIQKMLRAYFQMPSGERDSIAVMAPNYTILKGLAYGVKSPRTIPVAITSGQLVKTSVFKKAGFYKEELFIECVDHEFCLRLLKRGFKTFLIPDAILKQRIGPSPELRRILWKKFVVAHHLPHRYYYIFRNNVFLYKTYWNVAPKWMFKNILSNVAVFLKMLFFEERKLGKIKMIMAGCVDGIIGRHGKRK